MTDKRGSTLAERSQARKERYRARAKLEEKLGRKLKPGEECHHITAKGTKSSGYDNSAGNLEAKTRSSHADEKSNGQRGKDSVPRKKRSK